MLSWQAKFASGIYRLPPKSVYLANGVAEAFLGPPGLGPLVIFVARPPAAPPVPLVVLGARDAVDLVARPAVAEAEISIESSNVASSRRADRERATLLVFADTAPERGLIQAADGAIYLHLAPVNCANSYTHVHIYN